MGKSSRYKFLNQDWEGFKIGKSEFETKSTQEKLRTLAQIGHLAASSHNTQPWKFFLDEDAFSILLYLDRSLVLPVSDVVGRQALVSMGCPLTNLCVAAEYFGLEAKIKFYGLVPKQVMPYPALGDRYVRIAAINFINLRAKQQLSGLYGPIFSRKILRAEYNPSAAVPIALIRSFEKACAGQSVKLLSITSQVRKLALAEFQSQADGYVINTEKFARELGEWLLPNNTRSGLGMPGVGFGLPDEQALRMHLGLLGKKPLEPEDGLRFALFGKLAIEKSPFIGLIAMPKDTPANWLAAGMALQHCLLLAEEAGFSAAIHAAVVEVALVNRMLSLSLGTTKKIATLFRIGKPKDPSSLSRPHAPRLGLQDVLLKTPY